MIESLRYDWNPKNRFLSEKKRFLIIRNRIVCWLIQVRLLVIFMGSVRYRHWVFDTHCYALWHYVVDNIFVSLNALFWKNAIFEIFNLSNFFLKNPGNTINWPLICFFYVKFHTKWILYSSKSDNCSISNFVLKYQPKKRIKKKNQTLYYTNYYIYCFVDIISVTNSV